ncbi:MAG: RES family NAD+ phosphorylase [Candidatus Auribacterota bacterium]|nr:RES family NAD+ phosphorylase [Candidatus Auribacterota bacterium]
MKSTTEIKKVLHSLQGVAVEGSFYRSVGVENISDLLSSVGSQIIGGRYNLKNGFEVLYMASEPESALNEVVRRYPFRLPPQVIITIDVAVREVLDMEDRHVVDVLGIDIGRLLSPWYYPSDQESYTQTLGRLIYESGCFEGIRYPSAVSENKYNLAIFPGRLKKVSWIQVYDADKLVKQEIKGKA